MRPLLWECGRRDWLGRWRLGVRRVREWWSLWYWVPVIGALVVAAEVIEAL